MDMEQLYSYVPRELVTFVLVTLFSLLIGLSQRRISLKREGETTLFGTDRTFTFIGILGYLLYILDPTDMRLFMGGGAVLGLLLGLNYYVKQSQFHVFGVTTIIIALITYCMAPIVATQPSWFYVMVVVTVLLLTELKHTFTEFAQRMKNDEMITLAKFLAISGIILPMLPHKNLIPDINLTPYSIWLATVVVSGISYLSYLLKRYVFHESGTLVSGIIGGLYSSTATISVLARKSRKASEQEATDYVAAMLLAVSMMFLRFMILILIFSREIFLSIYPYLLTMAVVAAIVAWFIHSRQKRPEDQPAETEDNTQNLCIFLCQQLYANARNCCGTICTDEVCGEECLWCTRFLVVQNDHQNGTRQTLFPIFYIRTIPLHASHIELSAQICRHCHEPSVRAILRHVRKFRIVWKANHAAVRISILAAHPVIAIIQQLYNLFHTVGTRNDVVYASCQHILFT